MTMLNLETAYPAHISQIDENRRVEIISILRRAGRPSMCARSSPAAPSAARAAGRFGKGLIWQTANSNAFGPTGHPPTPQRVRAHSPRLRRRVLRPSRRASAP